MSNKKKVIDIPVHSIILFTGRNSYKGVIKILDTHLLDLEKGDIKHISVFNSVSVVWEIEKQIQYPINTKYIFVLLL